MEKVRCQVLSLRVTAANELQEQMRGIGLKGQTSEFIDDQELWLGKLREPLFELALAVTFGKLRNDCGGCNEPHRMPSQNRFTPQRDRKVRLANGRWPKLQHVLASRPDGNSKLTG